jgi:uncharacterized protein Smg (DUF494 family)
MIGEVGTMSASDETLYTLLVQLERLNPEQRCEVLQRLVALEHDKENLRQMAEIILLALGEARQRPYTRDLRTAEG